MLKANYRNYSSVASAARRHLVTSLPYFNISKIYNILRSRLEYVRGSETVRSKPFFIKIEPTNKCNLRCPGCAHAAGNVSLAENINLGNLDFKIFAAAIESLKKYLVKVSLYFEGESLLNPEVSRMVKFLSDRKIASVLSSNLNYLPDRLASELVAAKLTHLIVCLDGYDEPTYQRYRRGGRLGDLMENLEKIKQEKQKQNSRLPWLEIQAINFSRYSEAEKNKIEELARSLGAGAFTWKNDLEQKFINPSPAGKRCFWLYGHPAVKQDGAVQPCCYYYERLENDFGDLKKNSLEEILNNRRFRAARRYFKTGEQDPELALPCYRCNFFKYEN